MKQRITYVVTEPESFNPEKIEVNKNGSKNGDTFALKGVQAAKEHRITVGLDEIPRNSLFVSHSPILPQHG